MSRRMVETCDWDDPWLMELPVEMKCLWFFIHSRCDNCGVWVVNRRLAEVHLGVTLDWTLAINLLEGRVQVMQGGLKWFIPTFIRQQHPSGLSRDVKNLPHQQIVRLLKQHGLPVDPSYFSHDEKGTGGGPPDTPSQGVLDRAKDTDRPPSISLSSGKGSAEGKPVKLDTSLLLAEMGIPNGKKVTAEWAGLLNKIAKVRSTDEARAFLKWAIYDIQDFQKIRVQYARHAQEHAIVWDSVERAEQWTPKLKSKEAT